MSTRLHVVSQDVGTKYLVDAPNAAQAIRHVTHGMFEAKPATPKDVARLMDDGVKVEVATRDRAGEAAEASTRG